MYVVEKIGDLRRHLNGWRQSAETLALVPTMGNLHAGHIALLETAKQYADKTAVSLFVNPTQFDCQDDFARYPRTIDADLERLRSAGADLVFMPEEQEIYPAAYSRVYMTDDQLATELCGAHRAGHFQGVLTVAAKLFHLFAPDAAVFGEKDYQQLTLIKAMVKQLFFNMKIISVPTVREADGLAMSSRNSRLNDEERQKAPLLYHVLCDIAERLKEGGEIEASVLQARQRLEQAGFKVDYVEVRQADTLQKIATPAGSFVALAAAALGTARLIDNVAVVVPASSSNHG